MAEFLYHTHPDRDCTYLDPRLWVAVDAKDENEAVKKALEREFHSRPTVLYLSKGTLRRKDGLPVIVTKNRIQWGSQKVA